MCGSCSEYTIGGRRPCGSSTARAQALPCSRAVFVRKNQFFLITLNGASRAEPGVRVPSWEASAGCPWGTVYSHHFSGVGSEATVLGLGAQRTRLLAVSRSVPGLPTVRARSCRGSPPLRVSLFLGSGFLEGGGGGGWWGAGGHPAGCALGTRAGVGHRGSCTELTSGASRSPWGHSEP